MTSGVMASIVPTCCSTRNRSSRRMTDSVVRRCKPSARLYLAVDLGRGRAGVANIIAYGLQGPSSVNQALHAGVTKRMRSQTRSDDAGLVQIMRSPGGDGRLSDGRAGGRHMKEHLT